MHEKVMNRAGNGRARRRGGGEEGRTAEGKGEEIG